MGHGIGKTGTALNMSMNTRDQWVRTEVYFSGKWAKSDFLELYAQRDEIEAKLGETLDWQELPDKKDARICIARSADVNNTNDWPAQHAWLVQKATRMHEVFKPYIMRLERQYTRGDSA